MENVITAEKLTSWLAGLTTPLQQLATAHASLYASMRPALTRVYAEAGYPYGFGEDAMLAWWQERAAAERARAAGRVSFRSRVLAGRAR